TGVAKITFEGNNVTEIQKGAFDSTKDLKDITLPEGLEIIGESAFGGSGITDVIIPKSVTEIGESAFSNMTSLNTFTFEKPANLETIPRHIIYNSSFKGSDLSIEIPNSVKAFGSAAFENSYLYGITYEATALIKDIPADFSFGNHIKTIYIPASVETIGWDAFSACIDVTDIIIEKGSQLTSVHSEAFRSLGGVSGPKPINITVDPADINALDTFTSGDLNLSQLETYNNEPISDGLFIVNNKLFSYSGTETVIDFIPETVTEIGNGVFEERALTSITIPASVKSIGEKAFKGNYLTTINFEANSQLTNIGVDAFRWQVRGSAPTGAIPNLTIPASVQTIGKGAFLNIGLENLSFEPGSQLTVIEGDSDNAANSNDGAFRNNNLQSVSLPETVARIGAFAFHSNNAAQDANLTIQLPTTNIGGEWVDGNDQPVTELSDIEQDYIRNFTITFDTNGGDAVDDLTYNIDSEFTLPTTNDVTKEGYALMGWYESANPDDIITEITAGSYGDKTLYAAWGYNVVFKWKVVNASIGSDFAGVYTVKPGEAIAEPELPDLEGYSFKEWDKPLSNITEHTTITALYQINVEFIYDDGTSTIETVDFGADARILVPNKKGYTTHFSEEVDYITVPIETKVTYNGALSVTFDLGSHGTTTDEISSEELAPSGLMPAAPAIISESGWIFEGWSDTQGGDIISLPDYLPTEDELSDDGSDYAITYYAVYSEDIANNLNPQDALKIKVYPNPATTHFSIEGAERETLSIYSVNGALVKQVNNLSNNQTIQIGNLPKGMYLLKVGNTTQRLLIK
ncbi:MAG: leucine-rich repeat protein, partial [Bacteroidales bacterium]|nr:leucine-rich repeat protein [Bacteroidales bacterium]